jgi:two-component system OmpR family response regulator
MIVELEQRRHAPSVKLRGVNVEQRSESEIIKIHDVELDLRRRIVIRGSREIDLHKKEFELLEFLMRRAPFIVTKDEILKSVWGYDFSPATNIIDVLICRLRRKLDRGAEIPLIRTIRGIGYVIGR